METKKGLKETLAIVPLMCAMLVVLMNGMISSSADGSSDLRNIAIVAGAIGLWLVIAGSILGYFSIGSASLTRKLIVLVLMLLTVGASVVGLIAGLSQASFDNSRPIIIMISSGVILLSGTSGALVAVVGEGSLGANRLHWTYKLGWVLVIISAILLLVQA